MVEQPGFRQHKGADTRRGHARARARPPPQGAGGVHDVRPVQGRTQRIRRLEPDRRHDDPIRPRVRIGDEDRHVQPLRRSHLSAHPDHRDVETRRAPPLHFGQLVGGREGVEDGGKARIERTVKRKDMNLHGKNDIIDVILDNGAERKGALIRSPTGTSRQPRLETSPCQSSPCSLGSKPNPARRPT